MELGNNCQTETAIFLAAKHEKTIMACSYLIFFYISFILNFWPVILIKIKVFIYIPGTIHTKQKDGLETQIVFVDIFASLEIFGVTVQRIHQNSEKW